MSPEAKATNIFAVPVRMVEYYIGELRVMATSAEAAVKMVQSAIDAGNTDGWGELIDGMEDVEYEVLEGTGPLSLPSYGVGRRVRETWVAIPDMQNRVVIEYDDEKLRPV